MTRRSVLGLLVAGGAAIAAGVVAIPGMIMGLSPVLRKDRRSIWRPVGSLSDFPVGDVQHVRVAPDRTMWPRPIRQRAVFVWRTSEKDCVVYSRSCTDLGCPLDYDPGSACFFCPCHGGIFNQQGQRLAGPPDRPMFRYAHRIRDGLVEIDLTSVPPSA
jgi:menaquinol-cytochrome c reductase iron-sulfur subunit